MAQSKLPRRPNLEQLRKRARELLKAVRAEDSTAIGRFTDRQRGRSIKLADALAVVAHEYGFPTWMKLNAYVEHLSDRVSQRSRRRGFARPPSRQYIQELRAAVADAARQGDPFPFIFAPPIGPLRRAVQLPLREALVANGDLPVVVDVLLRGVEHPNPKIRFDCAHALDWLADERCLPSLLKLVDDPVPRVRWIAIHSLVCDDCKLSPLPACPEVVRLIEAKARTDPSARVRRKAQYALRLRAATH